LRSEGTGRVSGTSGQNTPLCYKVTRPGDSGLDPKAKLKINSTCISWNIQAVWAYLWGCK